MSQLAAWAAVAVLAGLVVFQLLLAARAPIGHYAWGGAHRVLPRGLRIASALATLVYAIAGLVILEAAGITDLVASDFPLTVTRILAVLFGIGVIMNAISRSRKERLMALVALTLAVLFAVVALGS